MAYRDRKKENFVAYWSFLSWKTASSVFTHVQQEAVSLSKQYQSSFYFYKIVKQQQHQLSELKEANERFVKKSLISFWCFGLKILSKS